MASARAVRRARRRRIMWAMTALLALGAGALALWPASDRYRASAVVQVGAASTQGLPVTTVEYDAQTVSRPDAVSRIVDSVLGADVLRAHLTTTASSQATATRRVSDAAQLVRTTAAAASLPHAQADAKTALDGADATLREKRAARDQADADVAHWRATTGNNDPPQHLDEQQQLYDAALRNGTAGDIKSAKQQLDNASAQNEQYQKLTSKALAARDAVQTAEDARVAAHFRVDQLPSASPTVAVSPVQEETIPEGRPPGRLSLAAIMLVLAIAAADALFLTRVKYAVPLPDAPRRAQRQLPEPLPTLVPMPAPASAPSPEPVRTRRPEPLRPVAPEPLRPVASEPLRPVAPEPARALAPEPEIVPLHEPVILPLPEPVSAAVPNRRRYPRRRRERVAASPLDLPNIEVHLLDREGGLRSIQLRNATGTQATKAQHPREQ